ncbi:hypothetical protein RF55_10851 [Lasius niger]|uniref:Peptidase A2 domain-containing protein n=1 Tax=Lasius niger TaxID=67767 RepID=A0A0J7KGZ0_LASNI|nr:hypothetical protein RF55_10851 [Lasius niger]
MCVEDGTFLHILSESLRAIMSEALAKQMLLQRSIERSLDNFKKIGRNNLTAAKIRSRISSLKDLWNPYQEGHAILIKTTPTSAKATLEYFKDEQFEATEDVYNTTMDFMADCLEELEPVECKSKYTCRSCSKKHHTMLHADSDSGSNSSAVTPRTSQPSQSAASQVEINSLLASATPGVRSQIFLATAWVKVKVASGHALTVRALLDQGSEATFISEHLAQSLRAKRIRMPISISAVGGIHVGTVRHAASIIISPRDSDTPSLSTTALILNSLTSYAPKRVTDISSLAHLSDLAWADADPTSSDPIHIIIGADIYNDLIYEGVRKGKIGQPVAQNSAFGWVIFGPLTSTSDSS